MASWLSNALSALCDVQPVSPALPPQPPPHGDGGGTYLVLLLSAVGAVTLAAWLLIAARDSRRASLAGTPPRRNSLNPLHVLMVLLAWAAGQVLLAAPLLLAGGSMTTSAAILGTAGGQLAVIAASLALAAMTFHLGVRNGLGLSARWLARDSVRGALGCIMAIPVVLALLLAGSLLLPIRQHAAFDMILQAHPAMRAVVLTSVVVLAPLSEELFFRGILQSLLRRYVGPWWSIAICSAAFAATHIPAEPQAVGALAALAGMLGWLYERSGRLIAPIVAHAVFNAVMITTTFTST
jgi:membrane protease YdiL (CAAX protease family)